MSCARPSVATYHAGATPTSNPQHRLASNIAVNTHHRTLGYVALFAVITVATQLNATPIEPTAKELIKELQRPAVKFVPARVGWSKQQKTATQFNPTFERYGPQATARAVHASLKTALTPDPLAMGALVFCAFALRWMRNRREQRQQTEAAAAAPNLRLPRAA